MKSTSKQLHSLLSVTIILTIILSSACKSGLRRTKTKQDAPKTEQPAIILFKGATANKELANQCQTVVKDILKRLAKEVEIKGKLDNILDNPVKINGKETNEMRMMVHDIKQNIANLKKETAEQLTEIKLLFEQQLKECESNKYISSKVKSGIKKGYRLMRDI